jgi:predicted Rossmann-fold nucleotide-binding protein
VRRFPVILVGVEFWQGLIDWIRTTLAATGRIGEKDLELLTITDDVDEVLAVINDNR